MTAEHIDEIRVLLERDLQWRTQEIALVKSLIEFITDNEAAEKERKRSIFRKSIILSFYAHFEGFLKYSFEVYAMALNDANLGLDRVQDVLFVSSLHDPFIVYDEASKWTLREPERKRSERIMNRLVLVSEIKKKEQGMLNLPISKGIYGSASVVATESNLTPEVLDKILYGLGLHKDMGIDQIQFKKMMGIVSELVKRRNAIAHGENNSQAKIGVGEKEFLDFEKLFNEITKLVSPMITKALNEESFLKEIYRN